MKQTTKHRSEFNLHHLLNVLNRFSFVESISKDETHGVLVPHAFIQTEVVAYVENPKTRHKNGNSDIINEIVEFMNDSFDRIEINTQSWSQNQEIYEQAIHLANYLESDRRANTWINKHARISLIDKLSYYELFVNNNYAKNLYFSLKCYDLRLGVLAPGHKDIAKSLNNIAVAYHNLGNYEMSLRFFAKSHDSLSKASDCSLDLADCLNNLGQLHHDLGDYSKSLDFSVRAYEMKESLFDVGLVQHAKMFAKSLNNIAVSYRSLGEYKLSIKYFLKSFEMLLSYFGKYAEMSDSFDLADSLSNLGKLYYDLGDYNKSLDYSVKAYEMKQTFFDLNSPGLADSLADSVDAIATSYNSLGAYDFALDYYQRSLDIRSMIYDGDHPDKAKSLDCIGVVHHNMGNYEKAVEYALQAYAMRKALFSPNHPSLATSLHNIAIGYRNIGDQKNLLEYYLKSYGVTEQIMQKMHFKLSSDPSSSSDEIFKLKADLADHFNAMTNMLIDDTSIDSVAPVDSDSDADAENMVRSFSFESPGFFDSLENCKNLDTCQLKKELITEKCKLLSKSFSNISILHNSHMDYELSLEYFKKAYEIRKRMHDGHHLDLAGDLSLS